MSVEEIQVVVLQLRLLHTHAFRHCRDDLKGRSAVGMSDNESTLHNFLLGNSYHDDWPHP